MMDPLKHGTRPTMSNTSLVCSSIAMLSVMERRLHPLPYRRISLLFMPYWNTSNCAWGHNGRSIVSLTGLLGLEADSGELLRDSMVFSSDCLLSSSRASAYAFQKPSTVPIPEHGDNYALGNSEIDTYIGMEKRESLAMIGKRLIESEL
jgi:hypothetical protein